MKRNENTTTKTKEPQLEAANFLSGRDDPSVQLNEATRSVNGVESASVNTAKDSDTQSGECNSSICLPDRDAKISELAYYKAQNRGFEPGYELDDWLAAEQEFML